MTTIWILPLAIIGLIISGYLLYKRTRKEPVACLMGEDCNKVVRSKYSRMFGVPNALLGVIYYIILSALILLALYTTISWPFRTILLILTGLGVLFYLVMIYIQFYKIKEWCGYCLISAIITVAMFVIELLIK